MSVAALFLPLAFMAPTDTPTDPVPDELIEMFIESDDSSMIEVCSGYATLTSLIDILSDDPEIRSGLTDMLDAWTILSIEADTLRLTPEARDTLTDWLHEDCVTS